MIIKEVRELLNEDTVVFNDPSFDRSIIGISSDGSAIYSFEKMVREYMEEQNCTYEDAADFIDYNTIRTIPYTYSAGQPPVVMYEILEL